MEPLQSLDTNTTPAGKRKVSQLRVAWNKNAKVYRLRCIYLARVGAVGQKKQTAFRYTSRDEALCAADEWTKQLEAPRRKSVSPVAGESDRIVSTAAKLLYT